MEESVVRINWLNAVFLFGIPPLALGTALWHGFTFGLTWVEAVIFIIWYLGCGMSITVGYHRLFSHRSHSAAWPLRLTYALFGAGAFQNSILTWTSDHRRHHKHTDDSDDPYSATRGFWWSHFLWVFVNEDDGESDFSNVRDLQQDWVVRFQHRHIFLIGFLVGMVLPGLVGYALGGLGGAIGGFVWGGLVRTVMVQHGTFLINSAAHIWGNQPYSKDDSSKDCAWLAFLTFGEGYHNYHHTFQADYRNGHRWWQFDPSKWWIRISAALRLSSDLKRTPKWRIETTRMNAVFDGAADDWRQERGDSGLDSFKGRATESKMALVKLMRELERKRQERIGAMKQKRTEISRQMKELRDSLNSVRQEFQTLISEMMNGSPMFTPSS